MVEIFIKNLGVTIQETDNARPLLRVIQKHGVDWMHACGAKGRCTTCKAIIHPGNYSLSPLTVVESRYAAKGLLRNSERLACQVVVIEGVLEISVPDEYKLPHLKYL